MKVIINEEKSSVNQAYISAKKKRLPSANLSDIQHESIS